MANERERREGDRRVRQDRRRSAYDIADYILGVGYRPLSSIGSLGGLEKNQADIRQGDAKARPAAKDRPAEPEGVDPKER